MSNRGGEPPSHTQKIGVKGTSDQSYSRALTAGDDLDMRIAADGTWYHEGAPIARKALVKLFASVLQRDPDGSYWLRPPLSRRSRSSVAVLAATRSSAFAPISTNGWRWTASIRSTLSPTHAPVRRVPTSWCATAWKR